jgi:hypothetical protein
MGDMGRRRRTPYNPAPGNQVIQDLMHYRVPHPLVALVWVLQAIRLSLM